MKTNNLYLVPFELCRFEEGFNKLMVIDLQRGKTFSLPKSALKILELFYKNTGIEVFERYKNNIPVLKTLEEYYDFLLKEELCFHVSKSEKKLFKKVSEKWETPTIINSIHIKIDHYKISDEYIQNLCELIIKLNVKALLLDFNNASLTEIYSFIKALNITTVQHIEISFRNYTYDSEAICAELIKNSFRVNKIYFYNSKKTELIDNGLFKTYFINDLDINQSDSNSYFNPIIDYHYFNYLESKNHNLFYNKKLFFRNSDLLNNFHDNKVCGDLMELHKSKLNLKFFSENGISELWDIDKGKIEICKDCEYRRVCLDDRLPIKNDTNTWQYLTECMYNPFISKWNNESDFLPLREIGVQMDNLALEFDFKKIKLVNQELWGD